MAIAIISPEMVRVKVSHTEVHINPVTIQVYIDNPGGDSSWTISSKTHHITDDIFTGDPILQTCHKVVRLGYLNLIRIHLGENVVR